MPFTTLSPGQKRRHDLQNATETSIINLVTIRTLTRVALGPVHAALLLCGLTADPATGQAQIKDIVEFEGMRDDLLAGYGLVADRNI
jgi:hypothetical protein